MRYSKTYAHSFRHFPTPRPEKHGHLSRLWQPDAMQALKEPFHPIHKHTPCCFHPESHRKSAVICLPLLPPNHQPQTMHSPLQYWLLCGMHHYNTSHVCHPTFHNPPNTDCRQIPHIRHTILSADGRLFSDMHGLPPPPPEKTAGPLFWSIFQITHKNAADDKTDQKNPHLL